MQLHCYPDAIKAGDDGGGSMRGEEARWLPAPASAGGGVTSARAKEAHALLPPLHRGSKRDPAEEGGAVSPEQSSLRNQAYFCSINLLLTYWLFLQEQRET